MIPFELLTWGLVGIFVGIGVSLAVVAYVNRIDPDRWERIQ